MGVSKTVISLNRMPMGVSVEGNSEIFGLAEVNYLEKPDSIKIDTIH